MAVKNLRVESQKNRRTSRSTSLLRSGFLLLVVSTTTVESFVPAHNNKLSYSSLMMTPKQFDDDIAKLQAKARMLLEKSKAKLEKATPVEEEEEPLPFFATRTKVVAPQRNIVKAVNEETGFVIADGEKMAALSEVEQWEWRSLSEVFENEISENEDVYSLASQQLADKDVAMQIFNLRKVLQDEDYNKIFDKRNWFIGEDS